MIKDFFIYLVLFIFFASGCGKKESSKRHISSDIFSVKNIGQIIVVTGSGGLVTGAENYYQIGSEITKEFLKVIEQTTQTGEGMSFPSVTNGGIEIYLISIDERYNYHIFIPPGFEGVGKTPRAVLEKKGVELPPDNQYENSFKFSEFLETKGKPVPEKSLRYINGALGPFWMFANGSVTYSVWRYWKVGDQ